MLSSLSVMITASMDSMAVADPLQPGHPNGSPATTTCRNMAGIRSPCLVPSTPGYSSRIASANCLLRNFLIRLLTTLLKALLFHRWLLQVGRERQMNTVILRVSELFSCPTGVPPLRVRPSKARPWQTPWARSPTVEAKVFTGADSPHGSWPTPLALMVRSPNKILLSTRGFGPIVSSRISKS